MASGRVVRTGRLPIDEGVLFKAWHGGFSLASDTAKSNWHTVAICASEGLITCKLPDGNYGRKWLITRDGIDYLEAFCG